MSKMKIKPEHFEKLKSACEKVLLQNPHAAFDYEHGDFARSESVKDLQKRFCFDVLHGTGLNPWVCDTLYPYMNDDHVYTALKACCPKVERKY